MGNYISRTNVQNRMIHSYDSCFTPQGESTVDTDVVDAVIDNAEGEVDSYISARYDIPVTDTEALRVIRSWALTLVEEIAYGLIPGREIPDGVKTRAKITRTQLEMVAEGKRGLGASITPTERADGASAIIVDGPAAVMGRTNLEGF